MSLTQKGDKVAFESLYTRYAEELIDFAVSKLATIEEAEDIIHDLFVYLWNEKANITIRVSFRSFLFSAVKYRIVDHIRKNITRQKYQDQLNRLETLIPTVIEQLDAKDLQNKLGASINNLSPRVRQVFKMSRYKNLSVREIAQELDITEQTVKNQLTTALSYLREKLSILIIFLSALKYFILQA